MNAEDNAGTAKTPITETPNIKAFVIIVVFVCIVFDTVFLFLTEDKSFFMSVKIFLTDLIFASPCLEDSTTKAITEKTTVIALTNAIVINAGEAAVIPAASKTIAITVFI